MDQPLWKNHPDSVTFKYNFLILESKNSFFLSRIVIVKHILLADFAKNRNMEKISNFWPKPWTNPFGKILKFQLF